MKRKAWLFFYITEGELFKKLFIDIPSRAILVAKKLYFTKCKEKLLINYFSV